MGHHHHYYHNHHHYHHHHYYHNHHHHLLLLLLLHDYHTGQVRLRQFEACISSGAVWDSLPITEKNTDSIEFEKLNEAVKINQWPGMAQLGRKDNLFTIRPIITIPPQWGAPT